MQSHGGSAYVSSARSCTLAGDRGDRAQAATDSERLAEGLSLPSYRGTAAARSRRLASTPRPARSSVLHVSSTCPAHVRRQGVARGPRPLRACRRLARRRRCLVLVSGRCALDLVAVHAGAGTRVGRGLGWLGRGVTRRDGRHAPPSCRPRAAPHVNGRRSGALRLHETHYKALKRFRAAHRGPRGPRGTLASSGRCQRVGMCLLRVRPPRRRCLNMATQHCDNTLV